MTRGQCVSLKLHCKTLHILYSPPILIGTFDLPPSLGAFGPFLLTLLTKVCHIHKVDSKILRLVSLIPKLLVS